MRFIPACAGFWYCIDHFSHLHRVHPRMCGVLATRLSSLLTKKGSSPHVRGFAGMPRAVQRDVGFIPACAGFCVKSPAEAYFNWVHPRMCGVLTDMTKLLGSKKGSSPHVRGFEELKEEKTAC